MSRSGGCGRSSRPFRAAAACARKSCALHARATLGAVFLLPAASQASSWRSMRRRWPRSRPGPAWRPATRSSRRGSASARPRLRVRCCQRWYWGGPAPRTHVGRSRVPTRSLLKTRSHADELGAAAQQASPAPPPSATTSAPAAKESSPTSVLPPAPPPAPAPAGPAAAATPPLGPAAAGAPQVFSSSSDGGSAALAPAAPAPFQGKYRCAQPRGARTRQPSAGVGHAINVSCLVCDWCAGTSTTRCRTG